MTVPSPLCRDPLLDGAADPTVIWNRVRREWWMFYTNRRAWSPPIGGFGWVHGTDIGIATSVDGGVTWLHRGIAEGLCTEPGRHTFWAPEVVDDGDLFHMFVTVIDGVPTAWSDKPRAIRHYTSADLHTRSFRSTLCLSSDRVIDAGIIRAEDGRYLMWYKDEADGSHTYRASSDDLRTWAVDGPTIETCPHEGPNVFRLGGYYWMLTDEWRGLRVFRSTDLVTWAQHDRILDEPGARTDDGGVGYHADVVVDGQSGYVFYFTHPGREPGMPVDDRLYEHRRSSIQVARLRVEEGRLTCDRDELIAGPFLTAPDQLGRLGDE
ncbi:hypothetical protein NVV95_01220 [Herbiconiux sp. CPCC 205716]|uniref:Glycosyl hydrolase n=1 Tax=Herbiconiux gentiana TaxID=2970912 RepID=A0ABT2GE51_9MICO|nr:hypothetical protein [Herbiconiux gentiana]MCS5713164.1 hypothetical protein [Herbiconiux gentiana]